MKPFYEIRSQSLFVGKICDVPFPLHVHAVVEIVNLTAGRMTMTVSGHRCELVPGDVCAVFSSVAHSYDEVSPDAEGLCLIFQPDTIAEFAPVFHSMRPVSPQLSAVKVPGLMDVIVKLQELSAAPDSPFIKSYLHLYLAHLLSCLPLEPLDKHVDNSLIQRVILYVAEHFTEPLTLDTVSHAMGVSRSHLSHVFSEQLNINFRKYVNILRIDEARSLLEQTQMTVTEICFMCGYNNPRTFHRAFLEECGMQPGEFRAARLNEQ